MVFYVSLDAFSNLGARSFKSSGATFLKVLCFSSWWRTVVREWLFKKSGPLVWIFKNSLKQCEISTRREGAAQTKERGWRRHRKMLKKTQKDAEKDTERWWLFWYEYFFAFLILDWQVQTSLYMKVKMSILVQFSYTLWEIVSFKKIKGCQFVNFLIVWV